MIIDDTPGMWPIVIADNASHFPIGPANVYRYTAFTAGGDPYTVDATIRKSPQNSEIIATVVTNEEGTPTTWVYQCELLPWPGIDPWDSGSENFVRAPYDQPEGRINVGEI